MVARNSGKIYSVFCYIIAIGQP